MIPVEKQFEIDHNSKYPIYYQLYVFLKEAILSGDIKPGTYIPSENEMLAAYGVSRITIRRAIADLEHDGLLKRHRGKGSIVLQQKSLSDLNRLYSFSESARQRGEQFKYIVISGGVVQASGKVMQKLNLPLDEKVFELKRMFLINGRVAGITTAYLPYRKEWANIFDDFGETTSLFGRLKDSNILIDYAEETIEVVKPSAEVRKSLFLEGDTQAIYSEHKTYDVNGDIIIYTESYTASDKFKYTIKIKRF